MAIAPNFYYYYLLLAQFGGTAADAERAAASPIVPLKLLLLPRIAGNGFANVCCASGEDNRLACVCCGPKTSR